MAVHEWRRTIVAVAVLLGLGPLSGTANADSAPPSRPVGASKIAAGVRAELTSKGRAEFWVMLADKADLRASTAQRDKADKAARVSQAAATHAAASQAGLRRLLADRKARFT